MQDLPRTFPGHPWLDTPEGHAALRRVLVGYSFRDCYVGYCQVIFESSLCGKTSELSSVSTNTHHWADFFYCYFYIHLLTRRK